MEETFPNRICRVLVARQGHWGAGGGVSKIRPREPHPPPPRATATASALGHHSPVARTGGTDMCRHPLPCPSWNAPDHAAAHVVAAHPEQGWTLLCNGVLLCEDTGALLPDGGVIARTGPPTARPAWAIWSCTMNRRSAVTYARRPDYPRARSSAPYGRAVGPQGCRRAPPKRRPLPHAVRCAASRRRIPRRILRASRCSHCRPRMPGSPAPDASPRSCSPTGAWASMSGTARGPDRGRAGGQRGPARPLRHDAPPLPRSGHAAHLRGRPGSALPAEAPP